MGGTPPRLSSVPALDLIALLTDPGTFEPWDEEIVFEPLGGAGDPLYVERLRDHARRSGAQESVLTGRAAIQGCPVALMAGEFRFMGGSVGVAAGERVVRAIDRAVQQHLPVVALPSSGGVRIQEGTPAFLQVANAVGAVLRHRRTNLPFIVYLTHPTFGGVLASWGSLGQITFAMPGARIGFAGPRVTKLVRQAPMPEDVQVAENLLRHGLVDALAPPDRVRECVGNVLSVAGPDRSPQDSPLLPQWMPPPPAGDAWESVSLSRHPDRPGSREVLEACASNVTTLRGDGTGGEDDDACIVMLARLAGVPAVVVAQDRRAGVRGASMGPAGYRKARRGIALAEDLGLPLVTIIDTPGPRLDQAAEEGGLSAQLARCLADLLEVSSPTLALLIGEGGGGSALALLATDRVVCAQHAWLAPIFPEGAASILFRTPDGAPDLVRRQRIASWDLRELGAVDVVVPEDPPAHRDPDTYLVRLASVIGHELRRLLVQGSQDRLAAREKRYRRTPWTEGWSQGRANTTLG